MKRAGRIVYRLLTAASLLLLLATAGVWVRSYWVSDALIWYDWPQNRIFFDTQYIRYSRGGIRLQATHYFSGNIHAPDDVHFQYRRSPAMDYPVFGDRSGYSPKPRRYAALGFEWIPQSAGEWGTVRPIQATLKCLILPLYFPCLLFAILPAHLVLRLRRRRRIARRVALGCCIGCGYDLRASSGRCPECGRASSAKPRE